MSGGLPYAEYSQIQGPGIFPVLHVALPEEDLILALVPSPLLRCNRVYFDQRLPGTSTFLCHEPLIIAGCNQLL